LKASSCRTCSGFAKPSATSTHVGINLIVNNLFTTCFFTRDLDTSWRTKGPSSFILIHISNVSLFGNMCSTYLHRKLLAPLHILVLYVPCIWLYICYACYLLYFEKSGLYILQCIPCICDCVGAYIASCCILVGSCERLMDYPIVGGVICLVEFHNPKIYVHEEYYLELIFRDYLVSLWYVLIRTYCPGYLSGPGWSHRGCTPRYGPVTKPAYINQSR
jgi:hypothetical protein